MKKFENVTFIGGRGLFRATYLEKLGPLHIFFIILLDPADEYLCSGEVRKKSKVRIFFIHEKVRKFDVEGTIYYRGVI